MKKVALVFAAITITLLLACNFGSSHNQSITVKKTDSKYQFKASFPERKTGKVLSYIKKTLKEDRLFRESQESKESDVNLGDTVKFHLKSGPGQIEITFWKMENSFLGYQKLEKMCIHIKEVLR